jgi:hypothetical protein
MFQKHKAEAIVPISNQSTTHYAGADVNSRTAVLKSSDYKDGVNSKKRSLQVSNADPIENSQCDTNFISDSQAAVINSSLLLQICRHFSKEILIFRRFNYHKILQEEKFVLESAV